MIRWKRTFSNTGHNFWASFSNPEGLKAWGRQWSLQMSVRVDRGWWLESNDDTILSDINPGLQWGTAPSVLSVLNYGLPGHRWLQCWEIKFICTTPCQALGREVISAPSTSTFHMKAWGKNRMKRYTREQGEPLFSWQAWPQLSLSLDPVNYCGKRVIWAFLKQYNKDAN